MTMSLMQISKKKSKNTTKILVGLLGFLCCFMICGCANHEDSSIDAIESITLSTEELEVLQSLSGQVVSSSNEVLLYQMIDEMFVEVGTLASSQKIKIEEFDVVSTQYLLIQDSDLYVDGLTVEKSSKKKNVNHLVAFDENCRTKDSYSLKDDLGNVVMSLRTSDDYEVYVKDENRMGVNFQNRILYIDNEEILEIYENENSDVVCATKVPVLMYHFFYSKEENETALDSNYIEINKFDEQLSLLSSENYTSLTMRELEYFIDEKAQVPENSFVITMDDGHPSVYKYAYPIIKKHDFNATAFLIGGWLGPMLPYEFIEMRENGIEPQSHSFLMHTDGCDIGKGGLLQCVDLEEGIEDTIRSLEYVDGGFVYCYPFGDTGGNAVEILKQSGVRMAFTTEPGFVEPGMDKYLLPRVRVNGGVKLESFKERLN